MKGTREVVVAGLVCVGLAAPAVGQGLGDASKREKERREESSTAATSYSDDDLEGLAPVGGAEETTETAPTDGAPERVTVPRKREETAPSREDEEQRWRARVAQALGRIDEAKAAHERAASLTLVPGYELVDEKGRPVFRSVEELQENTSRAKARVEAAEKALDDLLEEARRAGVPPGWLR